MISTSKKINYGEITPHLVGVALKELVRRAIVAIRNERFDFEKHDKEGKTGKMDDVFTSADTAAQAVYLKSFREFFPGWGIVAEEDSFRIPCTDGSGLYLTVDPLDGTKAFTRLQSHGVGTMVSLSHDDEYLAAFVGDVNTQEIYGFRPESEKVHRISEFSMARQLVAPRRFLMHSNVLLRDPSDTYSPQSQIAVKSRFKNHMVDGGSIGTWMARLWKGEVSGALIEPSMENPWDANPVNAITTKLGYVYLHAVEGSWVLDNPKASPDVVERKYDTLIIHRNNLDEFMSTQS